MFLTGADILVDGRFLTGHGVLIDGRTITSILPDTDQPAARRIRLPPATLLSPGLLDIQVNGGGGVLFNDTPTAEAALAIAAAHRRLGTTSILPTLITDTPGAMRTAASNLLTANGPDSPLAGIHFEGPFLSPGRPGVHDASLIRAPDEADLAFFEDFADGWDGRVLLTLAPEISDDAALHRLAQAGVVLSAGHSAASFERTRSALAAGITGFTHLYNAMPPLTAREPGIVAAALLDQASWCGVIADGIHVHPAMLRLLLAAKPERTLLVSDAMPPTGTASTHFTLQGRRIERRDGRLTTEDGTLAGADICLADAVRTLVQICDVPPARALTMASTAPADFLRLRHLGRIAAGARADLVLMTAGLAVLGTWLAGVWQGEPGLLMSAADAA